jgi:hypothetical protein
VLSMKEISCDPALRASGSVVEAQHKERASYLTVGSPIKSSKFTPEITASPLLGRTHRRRALRTGLQRRHHRRTPHQWGRRIDGAWRVDRYDLDPTSWSESIAVVSNSTVERSDANHSGAIHLHAPPIEMNHVPCQRLSIAHRPR